MAFLDEIASLLAVAGVGVINTSIFLSSKAAIPAGPGGVSATGIITLTETGGTGPITMHNSTSVPGYQRPNAQVAVRADFYPAARSKIQAAYNALVQRRNLTVLGIWYVSIDVMQEPFDMGLDEVGRARCAFNIRVVKRPS